MMTSRSLPSRLASLALALFFLGAQPWLACGIACQLDLHGFHLETSGHHGEVTPCHSTTLGTAKTVAIDHLAPALPNEIPPLDRVPAEAAGPPAALKPTFYLPPAVGLDPPPPRA